MATELLAIGSTETSSADKTLDADTDTFIYLTASTENIPAGVAVLFQIKDGSAYHTVATLDAGPLVA